MTKKRRKNIKRVYLAELAGLTVIMLISILVVFYPKKPISISPENQPSITENYSNAAYGISFMVPNGYSLHEWESDTFTVSMTNQQARVEAGPVNLEQDKTQIDIVIGGNLIKRNDFYWGGYKMVSKINQDFQTRSLSKIDEDTFEMIKKVERNNSLGYIFKKNSITYPSLNALLLKEGKSVFISIYNGNPDLVFNESQYALLENLLNSIEL